MCSLPNPRPADLRKVFHEPLLPCTSLLTSTPMLLRLSHGLGEMVSAGVEPWRATMFNRAQEYENQVGCSNVSHSPHEQHELADKAPVEVMEPTIGTCGKLLSDTMVDAKDGQMLGKSFGCSCQTGAVQTAGDWSEFTQSVWLDKRMEDMNVPNSLVSNVLQSGTPIMLSLYCWADKAAPAEGKVMMLLDDGRDNIPARHSGTVFPYNRRGILVGHEFTLQPGEPRTIHLAATDYPPDTRRVTLLLRGREGQSVSYEAGAREPGSGRHGLVVGSVGLRFVPSAYVPEGASGPWVMP